MRSKLACCLDHTGVGNPQLIKEDPQMAKRYNNRSVAEQNSLELSSGLLMEFEFEELRKVVCPTNDELKHFRELVVNSVMAVRSIQVLPFICLLCCVCCAVLLLVTKNLVAHAVCYCFTASPLTLSTMYVLD